MGSKSVSPKVEQLLKSHPYLRSDDKKLLLAFWNKEGLKLTDAQKLVFAKCTPAESVTRARRSLRGKYPGTIKVENARHNRYVEETLDNGERVMRIVGKSGH